METTKYTIQLTVKMNLCISCGICRGICPKECISIIRQNNNYTPYIEKGCIHCGLCFNACPGKGVIREQNEELQLSDMLGKHLNTYIAWSKDPDIRHYSASGGVTTTVIYQLLCSGMYDVAFVVNEFDYSHYIRTKPVYVTEKESLICFNNEKTTAQKSRYIPIGHDKAVKYMIDHPDEKIIFTGTPCAIRGLSNVIEQKKLTRDQYLLIGLFCESVMNYQVWDYFSQRKFAKGKKLAAIHFKNKESGGWPGNIKLFYSDGTFRYVDKSSRIEIKEFLKPERCLLCVDKLNVNADISFGDNYTGVEESKLGSNTVIIRTSRGKTALENALSNLEIREIDSIKILESQQLKERSNNINIAGFKEKVIKETEGVDLDINSMGKTGRSNISSEQFVRLTNQSKSGKHAVLRINMKLLIPHVKKEIVKHIRRTKSSNTKN